MLDYNDFNSQHTHEIIRMLFKKLMKITEYNNSLDKMLLKCFLDFRMVYKGKVIEYNASTLASRHI